MENGAATFAKTHDQDLHGRRHFEWEHQRCMGALRKLETKLKEDSDVSGSHNGGAGPLLFVPRNDALSCDRCDGRDALDRQRSWLPRWLCDAFVDYGKWLKLRFAVWIGPRVATAVVGPYDTALCVHSSFECTEVTTMGNQALHGTCHRNF